VDLPKKRDGLWGVKSSTEVPGGGTLFFCEHRVQGKTCLVCKNRVHGGGSWEENANFKWGGGGRRGKKKTGVQRHHRYNLATTKKSVIKRYGNRGGKKKMGVRGLDPNPEQNETNLTPHMGGGAQKKKGSVVCFWTQVKE